MGAKFIGGLALAMAATVAAPAARAYSLCMESMLTVDHPVIHISIGDQSYTVAAGYMAPRRDCVSNVTAAGEVKAGWSDKRKVGCGIPPVPPGNTRDVSLTLDNLNMDPGLGGPIPSCRPK